MAAPSGAVHVNARLGAGDSAAYFHVGYVSNSVSVLANLGLAFAVILDLGFHNPLAVFWGPQIGGNGIAFGHVNVHGG